MYISVDCAGSSYWDRSIGAETESDDLLFRFDESGGLEVALKDPDNPDASFDELSDKITIEDWGNDKHKVENLSFNSGFSMSIADQSRMIPVNNNFVVQYVAV